MKKVVKGSLFLAAMALLVATPFAQGDRSPRHEFRANLRGPNEVPLTLSGARGSLQLTVSDDESSVHFVLQYEGLKTHVLASHIHIGQPNVNGGVTVFFCGKADGSDPCPEGAGTVEGDFTADDVIMLVPQQLAANDLTAVIRAIRSGETYANLHTMDSPG